MDLFQCHSLRKRHHVYWISERKTNPISAYKLARLEKCILFEHRHQGRQSVEPLPVGTDCVKVQGITKRSAEAVPILPCVKQTAVQEVLASVLARFYTPLWYQVQVCWICGRGETPDKEISGSDVPGRVVRQSST